MATIGAHHRSAAGATWSVHGRRCLLDGCAHLVRPYSPSPIGKIGHAAPLRSCRVTYRVALGSIEGKEEAKGKCIDSSVTDPGNSSLSGVISVFESDGQPQIAGLRAHMSPPMIDFAGRPLLLTWH